MADTKQLDFSVIPSFVNDGDLLCGFIDLNLVDKSLNQISLYGIDFESVALQDMAILTFTARVEGNKIVVLGANVGNTELKRIE